MQHGQLPEDDAPSLRPAAAGDDKRPEQQHRRSVTFPEKDECEVIPVAKVVRKKDREALWFSAAEYLHMKMEAQIIRTLQERAGMEITDSDEHSSRGLEKRSISSSSGFRNSNNSNDNKQHDRKSAHRRTAAAQQSDGDLYACLSTDAMRQALALAERDAQEAAAYHKEPATGNNNSGKSKGIRKFWSFSKVR